MAFTVITKPSVGDPTKKTAFADAVIDNLNDLNSRVGVGSTAAIPNASFENDEDSDGDPDGWTVTDTGGSSAVDNTDNTVQAHGEYSFKISYPASASGGAYLETTNYIPVAASEIIYIAWKMLGTSATGAKHIVRFYWYQEDKTASSTASTDAYSDTANPTSWTQFFTAARVPSDAKFCKVRLIGSDTSATPSGTGDIYFDDVRIVNGPEDVFDTCIEFTTAGTNKWLAPGVRCAWVECWGGGGGGGSGSGTGGSGGGEYAAGYLVSASGTVYDAAVGAGGTTGGSGGNGGNSTFNSTTVVANGGTGQTSGTGTGAAGGTGGTGRITIDGGDGAAAGSGGYGGHSSGRGAGGGGASSSIGPYQPGGGGGGDSLAAAGAPGKVKIWFTV